MTKEEDIIDFYTQKSDMDVAKMINLALLLCNGISEEDAGFDIVTTINQDGLDKIAMIVGKVRLAAKSGAA